MSHARKTYTGPRHLESPGEFEARIRVEAYLFGQTDRGRLSPIVHVAAFAATHQLGRDWSKADKGPPGPRIARPSLALIVVRRDATFLAALGVTADKGRLGRRIVKA